MARTIGQMEKGIILQELADTREIDREFERELQRPGEEREQSSPGSRLFRGIGGLWYTSTGGIGYATPELARAGEALETIINDDQIQLTPELVEIINDPEMRITRKGEIAKITGRDVIRRSGQFSRANILPNLPVEKTTQTKKKRKTSKYQREFGKQMKMLIAKHPRTKVTQLMKRAHRATKKALK